MPDTDHNTQPVIDHVARREHAETIRGIEEKARAAGYLTSLTVAEDTLRDSVDSAMSRILDQSIARVIVPFLDPQSVAGRRCLPADNPIVAISEGCDLSVPQIVLDETGAAEELFAYLLNLGHTKRPRADCRRKRADDHLCGPSEGHHSGKRGSPQESSPAVG